MTNIIIKPAQWNSLVEFVQDVGEHTAVINVESVAVSPGDLRDEILRGARREEYPGLPDAYSVLDVRQGDDGAFILEDGRVFDWCDNCGDVLVDQGLRRNGETVVICDRCRDALEDGEE